MGTYVNDSLSTGTEDFEEATREQRQILIRVNVNLMM
jgi:hypothetical protein